MSTLHYYLDVLAYYFLNYFQETTDIATFIMVTALSLLILTAIITVSTITIKYKAPLVIFLVALTYLAFSFFLKCDRQAKERSIQKQTIIKYEDNYTSEDGKVSISCTNLVNFNNDQCIIEVVRIKTITPWGFASEPETGWIRTYNTERFDYE